VCDWLEEVLSLGASVKNSANLTLGTIFATLPTEEEKEAFRILVKPSEMAKLVKLADEGKINITLAQMTLSKMLASGEGVDAYLKAEDLSGVSNEELKEICRQAIAQNPKVVDDFLGGKEKAIFGLYGFIKRATQGKANMTEADKILRSLIQSK
jgi:aspartyl-tRNA(Asn)/glutamyl-tRNA(Gln) amidotransferase subunit B